MGDRLERRLGNYQLTRLLARGGFAEVYLAEHIYLKNQAAIKILPARLSNNEGEGFLNEARTLVSLIHPHIVRVLEFGIEGNQPFLVMDYAPNGSLRQCYPKGTQLPPSLVATYIKQAAAALQYAHDQKLVHRDIKPENMLLGRNNELLISDFGVAVLAHSSLSQSLQQVVGTVAYMAPEQVQGKPRPASDQYALAVVAYEWLCGEQPFHGNLVEIATQQIFADPPSLREKMPGLPSSVEQVIMTALAKDARQRYSTILDFASALESACPLVHQPVQTILDQKSPLAAHSNETTSVVIPPTSPTKEPLRVNSHTGKIAKKLLTTGVTRKEQIFPVMLGVLLYMLSSAFILLISFPSFSLRPTPGQEEILWILPALVIPVAFGIFYGFWAGLVIGGLGYFLGSYVAILYSKIGLSSFFVFITPPWYYYLGFLSVGSIAGLATLVTKGRYRSIKNIAIAEFFSIISVLVSYFIVFNSLWQHLYQAPSNFTTFRDVALPNIVLVLLLLPVILIFHNLLSKGKTIQ